jgi:tRNA A-37 threonylcarbamoyl transferase component Bud32
MKKLNTFLESQENEAHKKAEAMGLEYRGFGYWADPNTGKVVARSSGDELKPVGGDGLEGEAGDAEAPLDASKGQSFDGMMQQAAPDVQMGEVKPGEQKAPKEEKWKAGPDGDTDIGSDKDEEDVEDDAFVGKDEDSDKWTAGPDGDNFKTVKSFDKMQEAVLGEANWTGKSKGEPLIPDPDSTRGQEAKHEAERRGLNSDGHGYWLDNAGNPVAKTEGGKLVDLTPQEIKRHDLGSRVPGRTTMRDMMKGKREPAGIMKNRIGAAKGNLAHLSPSERDKYIDDRMATKDGTYKMGSEKGPYHKAMDAQNAVDKFGEKDYAEYKEVQQLNQDSTEYYLDPEYDLYDEGVELGSGAFGTVYMGGDGRSVIKEGQIGRDELQVMDLLKDTNGFPKLLKGEFQSGFKTIATWENDGITVDSDDGGFGGTFWNKAEAAKGRFAMSLAGGESVSDAAYNWDEITQENVAGQFWNKMAAMHKRGVSHNDLHGGNIFWDEDEEEVNILDLGLAKANRLTALMEGIASLNDENYQLWYGFQQDNLSEELREQLQQNKRNLIEQMAEDYSGEEWEDEVATTLEEVMEGDIRLTDDKIEEITDVLQLDQEQLQGYLDTLYEGFGEEEVEDNRSELEKRMEGGYKKMMDRIAQANGYSDGEAMAGMFNAANNMRRERGEEDIPFKGVDITRDPRQNK